jgi:uncharacterized membrane protein
LQAHWGQIPLRFPVHFGFNGEPDRWATRSFRSVFGPLIFGGELILYLFGMALAIWYGSRRSRMRRPILAILIAVDWTMGLIFGGIAVRPAGQILVPLPVLVLAPLLLLIPATVYATRVSRNPSEPLDPTPNECWKGGIVYKNPDDAALFVERRDGVGYTVNMGNRWSWLLLGGLLAVLASAPFVLA